MAFMFIACELVVGIKTRYRWLDETSFVRFYRTRSRRIGDGLDFSYPDPRLRSRDECAGAAERAGVSSHGSGCRAAGRQKSDTGKSAASAAVERRGSVGLDRSAASQREPGSAVPIAGAENGLELTV